MMHDRGDNVSSVSVHRQASGDACAPRAGNTVVRMNDTGKHLAELRALVRADLQRLGGPGSSVRAWADAFTGNELDSKAMSSLLRSPEQGPLVVQDLVAARRRWRAASVLAMSSIRAERGGYHEIRRALDQLCAGQQWERKRTPMLVGDLPDIPADAYLLLRSEEHLRVVEQVCRTHRLDCDDSRLVRALEVRVGAAVAHLGVLATITSESVQHLGAVEHIAGSKAGVVVVGLAICAFSTSLFAGVVRADASWPWAAVRVPQSYVRKKLGMS